MGEVLSFAIPTLIDVLNFYFFIVLPISICISIILYFIFEKFHINAKKVACAIVIIPLLIITVVSLISLISNFSKINSSKIIDSMLPIGITFITFFIPTIISYLIFTIIRRGIKQVLVVIISSIIIFLFFYPKDLVYDFNKTLDFFTIYDKVTDVSSYYESNYAERFIKRQSCSCVGIKTELYCYGMRINCKEINFDNCPWISEGELCPEPYHGL